LMFSLRQLIAPVAWMVTAADEALCAAADLSPVCVM